MVPLLTCLLPLEYKVYRDFCKNIKIITYGSIGSDSWILVYPLQKKQQNSERLWFKS